METFRNKFCGKSGTCLYRGARAHLGSFATDQDGSPMTPHEGWSPEPDPEEREHQRQRVLTSRLLFVIAVLLGVITPMLLERFF